MTVTVMLKWLRMLRHFAHIPLSLWSCVSYLVPGNSERFETAGMPGRPRPLRLGSGYASSLAKIHASGSEHVETEKTTNPQVACCSGRACCLHPRGEMLKVLKSPAWCRGFSFEVSQGGTLRCVHVKEVRHKMQFQKIRSQHIKKCKNV